MAPRIAAGFFLPALGRCRAVVDIAADRVAVGVDQIKRRLEVPAVNALTHGVALGDLVADLLGNREAA